MDDSEKSKERLISELGRLREQNRRLSDLIENSKDMLYRMSLPEGRYEYVNSASTDVFGYSPEKFYQSPLFIRKIIHPDWREYFEEQWSGDQAKGICPPASPADAHGRRGFNHHSASCAAANPQ